MKKHLILLASVFFSLGQLGATGLYKGDSSSVRFNINYRITSTPDTRMVRFVALVPKTVDGRQEITSVEYSVPPTRVFEAGGNTYAEYVFRKVPRDLNLRITVNALLKRYDLAALRSQEAPVSRGELAQYLWEERYLDVNDPEIIMKAKEIVSASDMETVRKAYEYVTSRLTYRGYVREETGAAESLKKGYGDCSDYSDVLITVLRAAGIAARPVDGYLMDYGADTPRHTWVEAYTNEYGWISLDPLLGSLKKVTFDRLEPNYMYLSSKRHDPVLQNFHFYWGSYAGGSVTIDESYSVEKLNDLASTN